MEYSQKYFYLQTHMPLYITVYNRFEAKPAEVKYESNIMYAKYNENLFILSRVELKKWNNTTLQES